MDDDSYPLTLYYESACPLCNAEMTNLTQRNAEGKLRFIDVSDPGFCAPPPGTTLADLLAALHGLRADGRVISGVEAFRQAYRAVGLHGVTNALDWQPLRAAADRLYPWLARHRHRVPRLLIWLLFETAMRRAARRRSA